MGAREGQTRHMVEGISVLVRVRPATPYEQADEAEVVEVNNSGTGVSVRNAELPHKSIKCDFDRVFSPNSTQEDVFLGLVPALDTVLEGFNACVLAYGQTGSGKTHTLIGPGGGTKLPDNPADWGVIPRAVQFLFDRLAAASEQDETFTYSVTCSFLQIYNENLVDLLQDASHCSSGYSSLQIREETGIRGGGDDTAKRRRNNRSDIRSGRGTGDSNDNKFRSGGIRPRRLHENRRVFVNGLSSFRVGGALDVLRYINIGAVNRRVRATQHNEASSRSHAVMQLMVEMECGGGGGGGEVVGGVVGSDHVTYRQAKLSLVDLAGSEKMDSSLNITRGHFNELRSINQSLSALGNVVSALTETGRTHVPYRDSKLTRLLQDSLGGNTRTTIVACVSPLAQQTNETVSTLQFADRAKKVMVRLRPNEVVDDRVLLSRAQAEIVRLKQLLRQALDNTLRADHSIPQEEAESMGYVSKCDRNPNGGEKGRSKGIEPLDSASVLSSLTGARAATTVKLAMESEFRPTTGGTNSAVTTEGKWQMAKLMAENERLREDNERLTADFQRLSREQIKTKHHGRGRAVAIGGKPPTSSVDWSARHADAADQTKQGRLGSHSPLAPRRASGSRSASVVTSSVPASTLLSFRRREFDDDDKGTDCGDCGHKEAHLGFSNEQLRDILGEDGVSRGKGDDQEEAEAATELDLFRSEMNRVGRGNLSVAAQTEVEDDGGNVDAGVQIQEFQRLEDMMFQAQGRERRRVREERKRLASARTERLALEAELAALTSSSAAERPAISKNIVPRTPISAAPADEASTFGRNSRVGPGDRRALINNESWVETSGGTDENRRDSGSILQDITSSFTVASSGNANELKLGDRHGDHESLPERSRRKEPVTEVPELRQTGWTTPSRQSPSRRRPATSIGGLTGSVRSRRKRTGSESPSPVMRVGNSSVDTSPAKKGRKNGRGWQHQQRSPVPVSVSSSTVAAAVVAASSTFKTSNAKLRLLQKTYPMASPPPALTTSRQNRGARDGGTESAGEVHLERSGNRYKGNEEEKSTGLETRRPGLAYSVADMGLRLTVYSFRYDHYYECQIVGFDSRRRMHHCAYDATGEKQWHDLRTKRFEIVSQNGVVIRSTESAPSPTRTPLRSTVCVA